MGGPPGAFRLAGSRPLPYRSLFLRLQSRQSIWQFSGTARPPFDHGTMWSACISSNEKCCPQYGHTPFYRS